MSKRHLTIGAVAALLLWAAIEAPTVLADPLFAGTALSTEEAERVAREAYRRLEERAAQAGGDLRFQLSDFYSLERGELDTVLWLDLATAPGGSMIDVHRSTLAKSYEDQPGETRVEYLASWNDDGEDYLATQEGLQLATLTGEEVLDQVGRKQPEFQEVRAITSFAVRATMGGRERSYRAALMWGPGRTAETTGLMFIDHITQGVEDAATEELDSITPGWRAQRPAPPADAAEDRSKPGSQNLGPGGEPYPTDCTPYFPPAVGVPYRFNRSTDHIVGSHELSGHFSVDCRCSYSCGSYCRITVPSISCSDWGVTYSACHKRGIASSGSEVHGYGGLQTCSAGVMCGVTPCLFCLCGLQVQVEVTAATVKFTGGGTLDTITHELTQQCPVCEVVEPCGEPAGHVTPHGPRR